MVLEKQIRSEIVKICHLMHQRGFIVASDGNVSVKLNKERILITPSGINKGFLTEDQIIVINSKGKKLSGELNPSNESMLHIAAYEERSDIGAAVHAHPPLLTAFTVAEVSLARCILPEVVLTLGTIPTSQYATPCTMEGPYAIKDLIKTHDAIILDRHGSFTVGKSLMEAYNYLEKIEHTAQVTLTARQLGNIKYLSDNDVNKLISIGEKLGLSTAKKCSGCGGCGRNDGTPFKSNLIKKGTRNETEFVDKIVRQVLTQLKS